MYCMGGGGGGRKTSERKESILSLHPHLLLSKQCHVTTTLMMGGEGREGCVCLGGGGGAQTKRESTQTTSECLHHLYRLRT